MATWLRIGNISINTANVTDVEEYDAEFAVHFAGGRCRMFDREAADTLRAWLEREAPRAAQRGASAVDVE